MTESNDFERLSVIQNEILQFTWEQVSEKVDKFYVQGKITDDETGRILSVEGNIKYAISSNKLLKNSDIVSDEEFEENSNFVAPRIEELHNILLSLQGRSPVRFRWAVDTKTGRVESEWTYYDDLTEEEKENDFWKYWKGDFAWKAQLEAELATGY